MYTFPSSKIVEAYRRLRALGSATIIKILARIQLARYARLVNGSGLFDLIYYISQNPDVAKARVNPLKHYFVRGVHEGRDPHPLFNTKYYLSQNPDVARAGVNPLVHYLVRGAYEGRDPHPNFDSSYYLEQNLDVFKGGFNPLAHYVGPGIKEGRDPNPFFDSSAYLEQNPEVALKGINPLVHYLNSGRFHLRTALRNELTESGRAPLSEEHDFDPLVSVIIVCLSQDKLMEDAVLSCLLACSYPMEVIVMVDQPADCRTALVEELACRYGLIVVRQINLDNVRAREVGTQWARGQFIQFLDTADLLVPGKIDIQISEFHSKPDADICISDYELCDAEGWNHWTANTLGPACFQSRFSIPVHCALFRRKFLISAKFPTADTSKDDRDFWAAISSRSPKINWNRAVLAISRIGTEKESKSEARQ